MDKCLEMGGINTLRYSSMVKKSINHYMEAGEMEKVLKFYEKLSQMEGNDPKVWVGLAQLYMQQGEQQKAIQAAKRAAQLDPELEDDVDNFLKSLGEGDNN
jgi:tetratricopeptide (TPR) repeat protein